MFIPVRALFTPCFLAPLLLLNACGADDGEARALLARVQSQNYRSWPRAPGWETRSPSSAHTQTSDIFTNDTLAASLATDPGHESVPEGSLIVKDGYNADHLALIAIMQKRSSGWYWAEYSASGEPSAFGQPPVCTNCHQLGTDFIRAF